MEGIKKVIVTGASSGIGLAISKALLEEGYEVYGLGRSFEDDLQIKDKSLFHETKIDLLNTDLLIKTINEINKKDDVYCLINNAGVGYYGIHETLSPDKISEMVRTNLEVPMILSNLLVKTLKANNGFIINISSHTASKANPHGCAYGATKAGLSNFSMSLFEEERKYGLKVVTIEPDMVDTKLYRNADFGVADDPDAYLNPDNIAEAVLYALSQRDGCNITKICLEPKLNKIGRK